MVWATSAWSRMLLLRMDSAPVIQASPKFLRHTIFDLNLVQILHQSFITHLLPAWSSVSHASQVIVWQFLSMSVFHLVHVAYATFLFFPSGTEAIPALVIPTGYKLLIYCVRLDAILDSANLTRVNWLIMCDLTQKLYSSLQYTLYSVGLEWFEDDTMAKKNDPRSTVEVHLHTQLVAIALLIM